MRQAGLVSLPAIADDEVFIIDIATLAVVKKYAVASFPFWVAVRGDS